MTAPVTLFTGKPGAGKTAQLVAEIVRLQKEEPGRPLFAMGINGLREGLAADLTLDQLHRWWELPPGSIIALDECQEEHLMPRDRGTPSEWVQRITKVRHHGMSFLLTTQDPSNMSAYVRRLVGRHVHIINKFQTGVQTKLEWGRCMDDPESRTNRKQAVESLATLPKEVFDLYKSSQLHTMKPRVPKKVYLFGALVLVAIAALIAVPIVLKRAQQRNTAMISGGKPGAAAPGPNADSADDRMRRDDYAKWMTPRVTGIPWTAPAFDHLQVRSVPRLACMSLETGECNCVSEQGTKVDVPLGVCHMIVSDGLYNPYVAPDESAGERRSDPKRRDQPQAPAASDAAPAPAGVAGPQRQRATAVAYAPPTYGPWNPEAE